MEPQERVGGGGCAIAHGTLHPLVTLCLVPDHTSGKTSPHAIPIATYFAPKPAQVRSTPDGVYSRLTKTENKSMNAEGSIFFRSGSIAGLLPVRCLSLSASTCVTSNPIQHEISGGEVVVVVMELDSACKTIFF